MKITSIETATDIQVNVDFSMDSPEKGGLKHCDHKKHTSQGSLSLHCTYISGIYILEGTWDTGLPCLLRIFGPPSCLITHFMINGRIRATIHPIEKPQIIEDGQYHTYFSEQLQTVIEIDNPSKLITLCLATPFLQSQQIGIAQKLGSSYIIKEKDLQKLHEVKSLVESNLRRPSSLTELSQQSGLNEFKLKKGFKELFGHTVFGYLNELRMKRGKELLKEGYTVGETADAVGYKNAHHFTAAFKKKWGILPSKVKPAIIIMLMTVFSLIVKIL
ncbi:AraC-type DNA-binding protein [bacterium A37T11]|nr:AraC-type DNA-binding protein [bacterium A37T11]